MPDGIEVYENNGKIYLLTGNEGDGRDYTHEENKEIKKENNYTNIKKEKINDSKVETIDKESVSGLDKDKTYLFGGRSFSIFDAETMELVFDSGSDFERKTFEKYPDYFNSSSSKVELDNRSGKKGPEPEDIKGDVSPEGLEFINATNTKNPMLLVSNEISGTVGVYEITFK